ncbi:MAG: hypothetical protein MR935_09295 [Agathobaculum sp.]|uniref:hypothetical protein n=1 Tax=Agathobaculum sp. TaxID=2048138 RepID=UPI0025B7F44F|nr:hypothetical protein [Agathobaculum sp.]MCI7126370.1 hypothetical protein [Agathobaculum sp.]MDY3712271.1 hypothetical protein [Agathobaculum sp.]
MLKLLKYEWKACARTCLPLYGAVLVISIINRLFGLFRKSPMPDNRWIELIGMLMGFVYFGIMVAVAVVTTVLLIQRFYKSLLGDEGYLMFTLPVTPAQHIWAKTIIAVVMCALACVVSVCSILILADGMNGLVGLGGLFQEIARMVSAKPIALVYGLEAMLWMTISAVCGILFIYLCIALGHLAKKHRVAMAVVWYFVLSSVLQFAAVGLVYLLDESPLYYLLLGWSEGMPQAATFHVSMLTVCLLELIPTAVFFFGTQYILKNRLNLE